MNKFAERLYDLRTENSISRAQLAERLKVSVRLISYWERGQRECSFDTLIEIATLFNTTTDFLLGKSEF